MKFKDLFQWMYKRKPPYYTATKCGHRTEQSGPVSAFGHTITTRMPKNEYGGVDYCLDCISKMAIKCAWCGNPIFIGYPVTLYYTPDNFEIPKHAVAGDEKPQQLVGCLGWTCAETGADRAGFWLPDNNGNGYVHRIPTAYARILGAVDSHLW